MSELLRRDAVGALLRADAAGRRVFGICCPFGQVATVSDYGGREYREMFVRGSFDRSIRERGHKTKLLAAHDHRRFPVGRATRLEERDDGLHGEFVIANTREGDDVLTLIADGILDSFSIGFRALRERVDGDVTVRTEAALQEVSLVGVPAYSGAAVQGVRGKQLVIPRSVAIARISLMDW